VCVCAVTIGPSHTQHRGNTRCLNSDKVGDSGLVRRETRFSGESKGVDIGYTESGSAVGPSYWITLIASQVLLLTIYMIHLRAAAHPTGYYIRLSQAVSFVNDGS
jgi:hypothetical protein